MNFNGSSHRPALNGQTNGHNTTFNTQSTQMMTPQTSQDMIGRIKILESRNKKLTEEVGKYKIQSVQNQRQVQEIKEEFSQQIGSIKENHETEMSFLKDELINQQQLVDQLRAVIQSQSAAVDHNKSKIQFVSDFIQKRNHPNRDPNNTFSSQISHDFYAPIAARSSQMSHVTDTPSAELMTPSSLPNESNNRNDNLNTTPRSSSVFPSQIPQTPMIVSQIETQSQLRSKRQNNTQPVSQKYLLFEPIKLTMQRKFSDQRQELDTYFMNQKISLINDQSIDSLQELNEWSKFYHNLNTQLNIKSFIKFDSFR